VPSAPVVVLLTSRADELAPLTSDPTEPDLSSCVGLLPKPGCGTEPIASGDRGGAMQIATFTLMLAALLVIGVRIARAVTSRDRGV
jgi:hypothetical protein